MRDQGGDAPPSAEAVKMQAFREQHPGRDRAAHIDNKVGRPQWHLAAVQLRAQRLLSGQRDRNPREVGGQYPVTKLLWFHSCSRLFHSSSSLSFSPFLHLLSDALLSSRQRSWRVFGRGLG